MEAADRNIYKPLTDASLNLLRLITSKQSNMKHSFTTRYKVLCVHKYETFFHD
jgi:hypothetical protein